MYPFFSGLGGYVFGTNKAGNLNPKDIGVANPTFIKNSKLIDKWNKEGLINSKIDYAVCCTHAFHEVADAVLDHRSVERRRRLRRPACRSRSSRCPRSRRPSVPFLGVNGLDGHEVRIDAQCRLGCEGPRHELLDDAFGPDAARSCSGRHRRTSRRRRPTRSWRSSASASKGGVPMPNIPQMNSVWSDLGQAWVRSTKGAGAMPAARSFKGAARASRTRSASSQHVTAGWAPSGARRRLLTDLAHEHRHHAHPRRRTAAVPSEPDRPGDRVLLRQRRAS